VEDFHSSRLDPEKWTVYVGDGCPELCGFGNNELQYYSDSMKNVRIEDGKLIIQAHKEDYKGLRYTSAKLVTQHKVYWKYGRIEVRAKLPRGRGTWPAIWMLPDFKDKDMQWPLDGEIDIMEHVGYNQGMIYGTIHTQKYNHKVGTQRSDSLRIPNAHKAFHVYAIEWSEGQISWFVDDQEYLTLKKGQDGYQGWPFDDNPYYLILNLAVGGDWGGKKGVDDAIWPQKFVIDYVKYYKN